MSVEDLIVLWGATSFALFTLFLVYVAAVVGAVGSLASKYPIASLVAIVVFFFLSVLLLLTFEEDSFDKEQILEEGGYDESDRKEIDRLLNSFEGDN